MDDTEENPPNSTLALVVVELGKIKLQIGSPLANVRLPSASVEWPLLRS